METGDTDEAEEERKEEEDEFPAPPSLGDLEELAREEQVVPATPRTLRRADSLRQKMAARRIQRTWKHFYQELEEKKADTGRAEAELVEEEQEREDAISNIQVNTQHLYKTNETSSILQAVILGHQGRAASLAAARARGGIFTAR